MSIDRQLANSESKVENKYLIDSKINYDLNISKCFLSYNKNYIFYILDN